MAQQYSKFLILPVSFLLLLGVFLLHATVSRAQGSTCQLALTKVANGGEGLIFDFKIVVGESVATAQMIGGETVVGNFGEGEPTTLTELLTPGWDLVNITCETGPGISAVVENGTLTLECLEPDDSVQGECVFTNVMGTNIPTLSEWGMIAAALGLGLVGVFYAVKRRRTTV